MHASGVAVAIALLLLKLCTDSHAATSLAHAECDSAIRDLSAVSVPASCTAPAFDAYFDRLRDTTPAMADSWCRCTTLYRRFVQACAPSVSTTRAIAADWTAQIPDLLAYVERERLLLGSAVADENARLKKVEHIRLLLDYLQPQRASIFAGLADWSCADGGRTTMCSTDVLTFDSAAGAECDGLSGSSSACPAACAATVERMKAELGGCLLPLSFSALAASVVSDADDARVPARFWRHELCFAPLSRPIDRCAAASEAVARLMTENLSPDGFGGLKDDGPCRHMH